MKEKEPIGLSGINGLYNDVKQVIENARVTVYRAANFAMVQSYWKIGRLIVEEEQIGKERPSNSSRTA